ncbi:dynein heavy chain 7, axonemal [Elysia marginata]|uniref:Dynein heavy chain 7, axonemal n=1 Tax=Elysia marginata TaxID=1093978 RepID=A0AAV4JIR0_9GAST|nr:dynein heavy chain 7, axonemal [Elysia marginata]
MQKGSISPVSDLCQTMQKVGISPVSDLCQTMQKIPTLQHSLYGGKRTHMDTSIAPHIVEAACETLKARVGHYFKAATDVLDMYSKPCLLYP